jgi:hypothetical protein
MDIEQLKTEFIQAIHRFNMSFYNAEKEASRLQNELDMKREECVHTEDCGCTGYTEGREKKCGSCGDDIVDHPGLYPTDVFMPIVKQIVPKNLEITIAIYAHGCDIPVPLFNDNPELHYIIPRVQMLSAVPHACFSYGTSESYLKMLQEIYRDNSIDQRTLFQRVKHHMIPFVRDLQKIPRELKVDAAHSRFRDNFVALPEHDIYRIHKPIINREYDFRRDAGDMKENKQFGIYIVQSSFYDDDVTFSYKNPIEPLSQCNNIFSHTVSPSLKKFSDVFYSIMRTNPIQVISLQDVLFCLFSKMNFDTVRIIDLGCRSTCETFVTTPALRRLNSASIAELENQPHSFGKKKKYKKSRKHKSLTIQK